MLYTFSYKFSNYTYKIEITIKTEEYLPSETCVIHLGMIPYVSKEKLLEMILDSQRGMFPKIWYGNIHVKVVKKKMTWHIEKDYNENNS